MALTSWLRQIRSKYNINPRFIHTDKDIAEIKAAQAVWPDSKHQLCWWHLKRAITTRLNKNKLSTTPYDANIAHSEFNFIDLEFRPTGKSDAQETEDAETVTTVAPNTNPNSLPIKLKIPAGFVFPPIPSPHEPEGQNTLAEDANDTDQDTGDEDEEAGTNRRSFCPKIYRERIIIMVEQHLCAHPSIPGYSAPTPLGIRAWAVKQIYQFCFQYDLRECWAYLWENWYRPKRWSLWARAECEEIPVLKTTMICESQ